jgi:hypothetical protein
MKRARKTFKAILAVLLVGVAISVSSLAFAQGGGISGSVNDPANDQGIKGVIIAVKDVSTSALAGTGNTDALDNYSVSMRSLGNYTLLASKLGYDNVTAPEVIELSDMRPNRIIYDNEVEGGEKVYDTNLSIFWDHAVHSPWGSDQDNFSTNQFKHPYQGSIYYGFARSAGLNYRESLSQIASGKALAGEPIATGAPEAPKPVLSWETGTGKSYLVPALEIPSFILLLNGYDRFAYPNEVEGGKKSTTRTCRPSGIMPSTAPGGLTRTTSPRTSSSIPIRDPSTTDSHDRPASASGSPPPIPSRAVFSGRRPVRPHHLPSMTRSPAALPEASSGSRSSGWPAWFSKAMAASLRSGVSSAQQ